MIADFKTWLHVVGEWYSLSLSCTWTLACRRKRRVSSSKAERFERAKAQYGLKEKVAGKQREGSCHKESSSNGWLNRASIVRGSLHWKSQASDKNEKSDLLASRRVRALNIGTCLKEGHVFWAPASLSYAYFVWVECILWTEFFPGLDCCMRN